jgi:hypothetical protein
MKKNSIKIYMHVVTLFACFTMLLFSCSPETEDCPRYNAGVIPAGDQTLLKQILAKGTLQFMMDDTLRVFTRSDSSMHSRYSETIEIGPCGTEYYPERTTISYKLNFGPSYYTFRMEQKPLYPNGQRLTLGFYNGYYYNPDYESFSFDPTSPDLSELAEFRIGSTVYQSVKVIPSNSDGYLFISQNGEILEIRTSDGKIFTKAD